MSVVGTQLHNQCVGKMLSVKSYIVSRQNLCAAAMAERSHTQGYGFDILGASDC